MSTHPPFNAESDQIPPKVSTARFSPRKHFLRTSSLFFDWCRHSCHFYWSQEVISSVFRSILAVSPADKGSLLTTVARWQKSIFIPWLYATAQIHLQAWWLLKYLAGGGWGGLVAVLTVILLFTSFYCWFVPVSHMHLGRLCILHNNSRCVQQPVMF